MEQEDFRLAGESVKLVPSPRVLRPRPGRFALRAATPVTGDAELAAVVREVLARLPWPEAAGEVGEIVVEREGGLHPEGYRLLVGPDRVRIAAASAAGAFYAAQTIRQLLPAGAWRAAPAGSSSQREQPDRWEIECVEIEDEPATGWRGAHLDVSRHFFPKPVVLRFIDLLAAHKLNRLHLHLTDDQGWRIGSDRYPALRDVAAYRPSTMVAKDWHRQDGIPHGGCYTLADLAEIHQYAKRRMVTVVPEVEVPGHARALLTALPELGAAPGTRTHSVATTWGIFSDIMSPLPPTLDFLGALFAELLAAMPAGYVHIGGDECVLTDWESDPRIVAHQKDLGLPSAEALHAHFLRQVADLLADNFGARAIVWDEGFTSTASGTGLRHDTVVMAWHGVVVAQRAALAGYDVVAAPQQPLYFDNAQSPDPAEPFGIGGVVTLDDVAAFAPVPADWPDDAVKHLLGSQLQLWTEYIADPRHLDYMTFPRAAVFADVAWSGHPAALTGFDEHLARLDAAGVEYRPLTGPHPWQRRRA
jgi:hexosaminidase